MHPVETHSEGQTHIDRLSNVNVMAPFGTFPLDGEAESKPSMWGEPIQITNGFVGTYKNSYVAKRPNHGTKRELSMMILAGDCSVQVLGRLYYDRYDLDSVYGFVMPHEKPVNPETLSKKERLDIIRRLPALVRRLHSRNIVHGDLKPSNMLIRPDGDIRLCDFANASHTSEKAPATPELSVHYVSAKRLREVSARITKEQDVYAMGISIWELYVGHVPFCDISPMILPSFIKAGGRPDLSPIDDPKIRSLIIDCLDGVATPYDKPFQTARVCIRTKMAFGNCIANPPHTFHQLYRCFWCVKDNVPPPCPNLFVPPEIVKVSSSGCAKCIPTSFNAI